MAPLFLNRHARISRTRALAVPLLMLALGGALLVMGLRAVASSDVEQEGPVLMHVDDADAVTLAAHPWVQLTSGWLLLSQQVRFCDGGRCFHVVPLGSGQWLRDCLAHDVAAAGEACSLVKLGVLMDDGQWKSLQDAARGAPGVHWDVAGSVVSSEELAGTAWHALQRAHGLSAAPRTLLALQAEPPAGPPARAEVLVGVLLMFLASLLAVWNHRRG